MPPSRALSYLLLTKPKIIGAVILVTTIGFLLAERASHRDAPWWLLLITIVGTVLSGSGACALNQYRERHLDALMERTKGRPLPAGHLTPRQALTFALLTLVLGLTLLAFVNALTLLLAAITASLYAFVYTPLKQRSVWNTLIGSVPGALPVAGGWCAVSPSLDLGAIVLFSMLFFWQPPHFYAIAWIYRAQYHNAGFQMLPDRDNLGIRTQSEVILFTLALIAASLLLPAIGIADALYFWSMLISGLLFLLTGVAFCYTRTLAAAKRQLRMSLIYIVVLFIVVMAESY